MTEQYLITVVTRTDIMPGSGQSMPGVADSDSRYDQYGLPYMNAKTLKGHLREQMELLRTVAGDRYPGVSVESLLGETDLLSEKEAARIRISALTIPASIRDVIAQTIHRGDANAEEIAYALSTVRHQTRIGQGGVAADGSLRQSRQIRKGLQFTAYLEADNLNDTERAFLQDAVRAIQHIGTGKSKGVGVVAARLDAVADDALAASGGAVTRITGTGKTLEYKIRIAEPIKVGGNGAQNNEESLPYIPGSMVRGSLIGRLLRSGELSEEGLERILQTVRFSDVLPTVDGQPLFTCPSVYYASKHARREAQRTGKELQVNVRVPRAVSDLRSIPKEGESNPALPQEGEQAVGRGQYASLQNGLSLYSVKMTANLHVSVNAESMFRYEAIAPGQTYSGVIRCKDAETAAMLADALAGATMYLGGSRGSGYGRCEVEDVTLMDTIGEAGRYGIRRKAPEHILPIYALSNLILLDENGEETSIIDEQFLADALGITNVKWQRSYTTVHNVNGYNHTWHAGPVQRSAVAAGSTLYYTYDGELDDDKAAALEEIGVGLRREDGYGSILVAPDFSGGAETITVHDLYADAVATAGAEPDAEGRRILALIEQRINDNREDLALREAALDYIDDHAEELQGFTTRQRTRLCSLIEHLPQGDRGKAQREIRAFEDNLKNTAGRMYEETVLRYGNKKAGGNKTGEQASVRQVSMQQLLHMLCDDYCSLEEFAGEPIAIDRLTLTADAAGGKDMDRERAFYQKAEFLRLALYDLTRRGGKA